MTFDKKNSGVQLISEWNSNKKRLCRFGLYDPAHEHDACGVGMVVSVDGKGVEKLSKPGFLH